MTLCVPSAVTLAELTAWSFAGEVDGRAVSSAAL
jgi:hypothetical protein